MDSALDHILSQTRQNVEFLIAQRKISPDDGRIILAKLPNVSDRSMIALEQQTGALVLTSTSPGPQSRIVKAKAIWGYNEDRQNSGDLTFRAGDVIEIVEETNPDWWTGRYDGQKGLFPSNYVEKLPLPPPLGPPRDSYSDRPSFPVYQPPPGPYPAPGYQPPAGGYQPAYPGPPLMNAQYSSYGSPPPGPAVVQQVASVAPPQQPPKKSKFGGLGNTLAQSAAGGVGFGAGSAVGSGIVNAIF